MDERLQFVARRLAGEAMAELCRETQRVTDTRSGALIMRLAAFRLLPMQKNG
jgi:hypothetical protein